MRSICHPRTLAGAALLVCAIGNSAKADIVFDQPAVFPGSSFSSNWTSSFDPVTKGNVFITYDNFQLTTTDALTAVSWQGLSFDASTAGGPTSTPITGFTVSVYSDNAGIPGSVLYSQAIAGDANPSAVGTVNSANTPGQITVFDYSTNLNGTFIASANTPYWLSIVATTDYPALWAWTQGTGGDNASYQQAFYEPGTGSRAGDRAFTLEGDAAGEATPEPGALALLTGMGLTGTLFLRRRKQAQKAS